ncbi:P2Y purinoceptor 14-like, partial [Huso huso]
LFCSFSLCFPDTAMMLSQENTTTANTTTCIQHPTATMNTILAVVYSFIFIIGLVLNSLSLWVYFCHTHTKNCVTVYLKNLAIADFLLILSLPVKITAYSTSYTSVRQIYCTISAAVFYLNMYASILFMEYIGANRYLKIVKPLETYKWQTVKAAKYISLGTWILLLSIGVGHMYLSSNTPGTTSKKCNVSVSGKLFSVVVHTSSLILFMFVLASLCFFYVQMSKRLKGNTFSSNIKLRKSKKNILVLVTVFSVCFVPYHIVRLPYVLANSKIITSCFWENHLHYLKEFATVLSSLNACLDPMIYFIFCKAFRAKLCLEKYLIKKNTLPANQARGNEEIDFSIQGATAMNTLDQSAC